MIEILAFFSVIFVMFIVTIITCALFINEFNLNHRNNRISFKDLIDIVYLC